MIQMPIILKLPNKNNPNKNNLKKKNLKKNNLNKLNNPNNKPNSLNNLSNQLAPRNLKMVKETGLSPMEEVMKETG